MQGQALSAFLMRYILAIIMAAVLLRILHLAVWQWIAARRDSDFSAFHIGVLTDDTGREYGLEHDNILGRSRRCDIVLSDTSVSGIHAQIYRRRKSVFLQPFSRSGVLLNGQAVMRRVLIKSGDIIHLGGVEMKVELS